MYLSPVVRMAPTATTSQPVPMMLARWDEEFMNESKTYAVTSDSLAPGQVTVPMFSPASLKQ